MKTKPCSRCKEEKSFSDYYKNKRKKDGLDIYCKTCRKKQARENRERDNIPKRRWYNKNKDKVSWRHREHRYGITKKDFNLLLEKQSGCCAICKKPQNDLHYDYLYIDHSHKTGKVRGLLCASCNARLGWFENHSYWIAEYLKGNI